MNQAQRITIADDGTPFMDPFAMLDAYVDRYELADVPDEEFSAVVREWSEFVEAERLTGDLFASEGTTHP